MPRNRLAPRGGAPDGFLDLLAGGICGRALVEAHGDVGTEGILHGDGFSWPEEDLRAVEVRAKGDALVGKLAQLGQAEDLEAPAVGEDGAVPVHEAGKAAAFPDELGPGPKVQVVDVAQDDAGLDYLPQVARQDSLYRSLRADGHEGGRGNLPARQAEGAGAGLGFGVVGLDLKDRRCVLLIQGKLLWMKFFLHRSAYAPLLVNLKPHRL